MQADPITVGVSNDTQAHVSSGVVEVTDEVHGLWAALGAQHRVQLLGPNDLIGGPVRNLTAAMK